MTIDEAIQRLGRVASELQLQGRSESMQALKLGLEALSYLEEIRNRINGMAERPKIGETPSTPSPAQERAARGDTE